MSNSIRYVVDVIATLCGLDSPDELSVPGLCGVLLAAVILVYACFRAVLLTAWPGENDTHHVKNRVLRDEDPGDAN